MYLKVIWLLFPLANLYLFLVFLFLLNISNFFSQKDNNFLRKASHTSLLCSFLLTAYFLFSLSSVALRIIIHHGKFLENSWSSGQTLERNYINHSTWKILKIRVFFLVLLTDFSVLQIWEIKKQSWKFISIDGQNNSNATNISLILEVKKNMDLL